MSIEAVVRRDAISVCNRLANDVCICITVSGCAGVNFVEVSNHLGARTGDGEFDHTNHAWWRGKIYKIIDDGTSEEDEMISYHSRNLSETTGYGEGDDLGSVNCRHRMFPLILGIRRRAQRELISGE